MRVTLARALEAANSTLGGFWREGRQVTFTLEDERRDVKVPGETRIPPGLYQVKLRTEGGMHREYLKRFGPTFHFGMLELQGIPGFTFVYPHIGNTTEETRGCPLVGMDARLEKDGEYRVGRSTEAYRWFYPPLAAELVAGRPVEILVIDPAR